MQLVGRCSMGGRTWDWQFALSLQEGRIRFDELAGLIALLALLSRVCCSLGLTSTSRTLTPGILAI